MFLLGLLVSAPAFAQNPQPAPPTNPTPPIAPPNAASPPPERVAPGGSTGSTGSGTLSDRLSRDRGTVKPPAVDPGMTVAPPRTGAGTTPVIPPPGSPGGNQSVVPK